MQPKLPFFVLFLISVLLLTGTQTHANCLMSQFLDDLIRGTVVVFIFSKAEINVSGKDVYLNICCCLHSRQQA